MKKFLAVALSIVMMLAVSAVSVSAAFVEGVDFKEVGAVEITWDPDISDKITMDGSLEDWGEAGYTFFTVDKTNLVLFDNVSPNELPDNFSINAYYVADEDWLYIGFHIADDAFAYGDNAAGYNGDAFQIAIDFNNEFKTIMAEDPDAVLNPQNIFYSFCCVSDGAPLEIMRQNSDGFDGLLSEANGDGVKGVAKATEGGWDAEFALSWQMLFEDFANKSWVENYTAALDANHDLTLGITLCYLNRSETNGSFTGAYGTFNRENPTWTPAENGMSLVLKWKEGMKLTCEGIITPTEGDTVDLPDTQAPDTDPETVPETDPETKAPETDPETKAPETKAPETKAPETKAPETTTAAGEKSGCSSVIGGAVAVVLTAMAAGVALKKKH